MNILYVKLLNLDNKKYLNNNIEFLINTDFNNGV